ncbi:MAG TPA: hypothetical protein VIF15_11795 [Polyangiaceae bacterium]|jgi:hypothetical protein
MRPNLSFESLAAVLAALGTSAIVACGGSNPQPVNATDVAPAATTAATGQSSCSAKGCGATPAPPAATGAAAAPASTAAPAGTSAANGTPADANPTPATTNAPASPPPSATTASGKPPAPKPKGTTPPKKGPKGGEASCGAGTCASDPKQKIL